MNLLKLCVFTILWVMVDSAALNAIFKSSSLKNLSRNKRGIQSASPALFDRYSAYLLANGLVEVRRNALCR